MLPTVAALALVGCGEDVAGDTDADGSTGEDTTGSPASDPTVDPTIDPGTTTGETTDATVDPDTGSDSSGDPPTMCDADDECTPETVMEDCGEFFACVGCFCVEDGDPPLCPDGFGDGEYADCVTEGNGVCTSESGLTPGCVVDDVGAPSAGSCYFSGCESECDCPAAPDPAFDDQVACDDIIGDEAGDCYIDCSSGGCPDGMFCFAGTLCLWGDAPGEIPEYGDCLNNTIDVCEDSGICLSDDATFGACATTGCTDASDCSMAPETGDAAPGCTEFPDGSTAFCSLTCDDGETCPDGMICLPLNIDGDPIGSHCLWPPEPEPGFADCATLPDAVVCGATEACIETTDKTNGTTQVCAADGCVDPGIDCPLPPETGDAPAACLDIDGEVGDECVLDCSAGQTCPDGAVCMEGGFCSYQVPTFTFEEDFQGGVIPEAWTTWDIDGLTPAMEVAFVDEAWVVSDAVTGAGDFWAVATSWYSPAGTSDDWLISPPITLGATATLSWSAFTANAGFPDGYDVYVVPTTVTEFTDFVTGGDPTAFLALDDMVVPSAAPVFSVAAEEAEIQNRNVDIGALAGEEVHLAFHSTAFDGVLILIDNVAVYE
ncbi:MAG: choice-of-anchor J domain-containing protein [Nannocystaceae bacterium]|nr:choice-of-anchor J domain-containing protein [bacterium]